MDLSGLIFVVLALAWVGYLVPKALRAHDELQANRPVEEFSASMRVLDRSPAAAPQAFTSPAPGVESPVVINRRTTRAAAARRRRVLVSLLAVTGVVAGLTTYGTLPAWTNAIPIVLVFAWLLACRAAVRPITVMRPVVVAEAPVAAVEAVEPGISDEPNEDSLWDPLPLTLPTYVTKPAARRTIRTVELTGTVTIEPTSAASAPLPATPAAAPVEQSAHQRAQAV